MEGEGNNIGVKIIRLSQKTEANYFESKYWN